MNKYSLKNRSLWFVAAGLLLAAFLVHLPLMRAREMALPGDEVILGLMANRILKGQFPVYYLGQSYLGSLEAYATALLSLGMGINGFTVQMGAFLFYLFFLVTHFILIRELFGWKTGFFSSLLLIMAPVMFWEMAVRALGGYTEILFFGALAFLLWSRVFSGGQKKFLFPLGLVLGLALWINPLFITYLIPILLMTLYWHRGFQDRIHWLRLPSLIFLRGFRIPPWLRVIFLFFHALLLLLVLREILIFFSGGWEKKWWGLNFAGPPFPIKGVKKIFLLLAAEALILFLWSEGWKCALQFLKKSWRLAAGLLTGYSPALIYSLAGGEGYRILEGSGSIDAAEIAGRWRLLYLELIPNSLWGISFSPAPFFRIQTLWGIFLLTLYLSAFVFFFYGYRKNWGALFKTKSGIRHEGFFFCLLTLSALAASSLSSLIADRYLIYLYWTSAIALGFFIEKIFSRSRAAALLLLGLLIGQNAFSAADYLRSYPDPGIGRFIRALDEEMITGGFADYDTAYRLVFYSNERLKFIPVEGPLRIREYLAYVEGLERKAGLFSNPAEEAVFRARFPDQVLKLAREWGPYRLYLIHSNKNASPV